MKPLAGKVVVLTGASRGLGVDMAKAFASRKARLALAARSAEELEKTRASLDSEAITVPTDVRDAASLKALLAETEKQLGPVDVLVNNAGVERVCDFETMAPEEIDAIIQTNVSALMMLTRLAVPSMIERRSGHVVNVASLAGLNPVPFNAVYSASKHAVVGFSRSLRGELADRGVAVSVVCPGFVDAGMFAAWGRPAPKTTPAVTSEAVAKAVLEAVERNRAVVTVGRGLARIGHWVGAMAPGFADNAARRSGFVSYMREQSRINANRSRPD